MLSQSKCFSREFEWITKILPLRSHGFEKGGRGSLATGTFHVLLSKLGSRKGWSCRTRLREDMFREEQGYKGVGSGHVQWPTSSLFLRLDAPHPTGINQLEPPEHERDKTSLMHFKENTFLFAKS